MAYITPLTQRPYFPNNQGLVNKKEDEESSQSSRSSQTEQEQSQPSIQKNLKEQQKATQEQWAESKANHQAAVASRDANLKNASVNIAQILKDFKNTAKAIGASPELTEEVDTYLLLVENQAKKEAPDTKLIRSNLKNASTLLDNYISETLQRHSKVVENWIDALFLQQINYKFNEGEINPNFLVKFPNQTKASSDVESDEETSEAEEEEEKTTEETSSKSVLVPQDEKLKSLFLQGKKYAYANNSKKSMETFRQALKRALEINDKDTASKVLLEIGKIYDKNDYLAQALTTYSEALTVAKDLNVKTKAHYSMAQIYDDVAEVEPAINHYMSSISFAGESENLTAQSTSLTKIGNIFSDKYDKKAFEYLNLAQTLANEDNTPKIKGYVSSNIAGAYKKFNEPQNALKYYSNAVKEYNVAQSPAKSAQNYKNAAEIMINNKNNAKAKTLLQKALLKANQGNNPMLAKEIQEKLNAIKL